MHPGPYGPPPGAYPPPGPYGRNIPRYGHPGGGSSRGGCGCLKMIFCCCCCIIMTILLIIAGFVAAWFIIGPRAPIIRMDKFEVKSFNLSEDSSLQTHLEATVKSENPNKYIKFIIGNAKQPSDNAVDVFYSNIKLCSGTIPNVEQPKKNVTFVKFDLKGDVKKEDLKGSVGEALMSKIKNNEKIAILVATKAPVRIEFTSGMKLNKEPIVFGVNATMNVKNLSQGKSTEISDTKYTAGVYVDKEFHKF